MHKNTPKIKEYINSHFDDSYDRVKYLKNKYKGETVYILGTGPSIDKISSKDLNKLKNKFVISMKQSLSYVPDSDIHLLNFCNLDTYKYSNPNTIVGWSVWDSVQPHQIINNFSHDFILDIFKLNDMSPNIENSVAFNLEYLDTLLDINKSLPRPWGPGTIYELAIPLAVYMGCTKIITIGWDLYITGLHKYNEKNDNEHLTPPHCYNSNNLDYKQTDTGITRKEVLQVIKSTENVYNWLQSKGIELEIIS